MRLTAEIAHSFFAILASNIRNYLSNQFLYIRVESNTAQQHFVTNSRRMLSACALIFCTAW